MTNGISVEDLGGLSAPATELIKKVSEAVGGFLKPYQMIRVAKAQVRVDKIMAVSKFEIVDLEQRALSRFIFEETKKQQNIENITSLSLPLLNKDSNPEKMEADWVTNFFDKCRLISDSEMQNLWARILAGEANEPGKFSKRTIEILYSLDKSDAEAFTKLCSFNWILDDNIVPLIFNLDDNIYKENALNFNILNHLDTIGLINFGGTIKRYVLLDLPKKINASYKDVTFELEFKDGEKNSIDAGHVILTNVGVELASICKPFLITGFDNYIKDKLIENKQLLYCRIVSEVESKVEPIVVS